MFVYHQCLLYRESFHLSPCYVHDISSLTPIFILQIFYKSANQVIDFPNNRKNKKRHYAIQQLQTQYLQTPLHLYWLLSDRFQLQM